MAKFNELIKSDPGFDHQQVAQPADAVGHRVVRVAGCILLTIWAVWRSKHETAEMREIVGSLDDVA